MSAAALAAGVIGRRRAARWRSAKRRVLTLEGRRRLLAMVGFAFYLGSALDAAAERWSIVYDPQNSRCLEGVSALVIDKDDHAIERGDIYAFVPPHEAALFFPPNMLFAKRVMGVAGDLVEITEAGATVNGVLVAEGLGLVEILGVSAERYIRRFTVPEGHILMLGDTLDSFDGRYWGTVPIANGVGRARVLF